ERVLAILREWDRALNTGSKGAKRLHREPGENHRSWVARVVTEGLRRIESLWHGQRAHATRVRFQRVRECNTKTRGWVTCADCGHAPVELRNWCANHWACAHCREIRIRRYRRRGRLARTGTIDGPRADRMMRGQRGRARLAGRL